MCPTSPTVTLTLGTGTVTPLAPSAQSAQWLAPNFPLFSESLDARAEHPPSANSGAKRVVCTTAPQHHRRLRRQEWRHPSNAAGKGTLRQRRARATNASCCCPAQNASPPSPQTETCSQRGPEYLFGSQFLVLLPEEVRRLRHCKEDIKPSAQTVPVIRSRSSLFWRTRQRTDFNPNNLQRKSLIRVIQCLPHGLKKSFSRRFSHVTCSY